MDTIVKPESITRKKTITILDEESHMNELLNIVKLIYADTERTTKALNAELDIYEEIISRTPDVDTKNKYRIQQAQAAQKPAVNAKLVAQLVCALDRMRALTDEENSKHRTADVVFIDDTEKGV